MFEELYDNLDVVDASQPGWRDTLFRLLGCGEHYTLKPLQSIFALVQGMRVETVVLEKEYVDADFSDEFRTHYYRQFTLCHPRCKRIHFFGNKFTKKDLPNLKLADQQYLGFSVVRPTRSFCTGRTILRTPKHDSDTMYTLCKTDFEANLCANNLLISGMPFIQQDTNVGVCAQAALWMTSLYMHQKFRFPRFRPSEITMAATRFRTLGPVRYGLAHEQMLAALREMGYTPLAFPHYDEEMTARIIYAYVESELPVILLVKIRGEGHAVVVIGHDYHCRRRPKGKWNSNIYWIDHFYIQDDAVGPYMDLLIKGRVRAGRGIHYSIKENAAYVIVPVYPGIAMQANDVFLHVDTLVDYLNDLIDLFGEEAKPLRFSAKELKGLVFRTYLRTSNDFKTRLPSEMNEFFQHHYKSMSMPHNVWVTEISKSQYLNHPKACDRKILGEIVIDSTADRHAHMESFLAIHLMGRMIIKIRPPGELKPHYALYLRRGEQPYGHLVRE